MILKYWVLHPHPTLTVCVETLIGKWTQENVLNNLFLYQWITLCEAHTWSLNIIVYRRYMPRLICFFLGSYDRSLWLYLGDAQICE